MLIAINNRRFSFWGRFVTGGSYLGNIGFSGTDIGSTYLMNDLGANGT